MRVLNNDSLYIKLNLLVSLLMVQVLNDIFCIILFSGCSLGIGVDNSLFTMQKANVQ